jgi:hypothetical protein
MTLRRIRPFVFALVMVAGLLGAGRASAKTLPGAPPFRVVILDHVAGWQLRDLARHGAIGLLVPGAGPVTNRRQALAQLVRGEQENAHLGGVPSGPPLLSASLATGTPSDERIIVVTLPPKGSPVANDKRYYVAVLGAGFRGLLVSRTTRIPGLVSIVDIAPTALGHLRGTLTWQAAVHPVAALKKLNAQIHANNRLKLPALIILACLVALLAGVRARAALTAVPAALLVNIALGAMQVSNEVAILAVLIIATIAGSVWLARVCSSDLLLLLLFVGVLLLHLYLLTTRPTWIALTPFGPTQNSRFWGLGNQLSTLMLVPMIAAAVIAARRVGALGFGAVALFSIGLMTDNRLGSNGGGAVVLVVAFAFLGAKTLRTGLRGFVLVFVAASAFVVWLIEHNLNASGPDHLRSAFNHGLGGFWGVARDRVPLSYLPAIDNWTVVLPLTIWFVVSFAVAIYVARSRATRDLVFTLGVATLTSLLINDSAMYVLTGGVAALASIVRFVPAPAIPYRLRSMLRIPVPAQQAASSEGI